MAASCGPYLERAMEHVSATELKCPLGDSLTFASCRRAQIVVQPRASCSWAQPGSLGKRKTNFSRLSRLFSTLRTGRGHLHQEELLALFCLGDVRRHVWVLRARQRNISIDISQARLYDLSP